MGTVGLSGLAFYGDCSNNRRSGLSHVLNYYRRMRLSSRAEPLRVTIDPGTVLNCYLQGFRAETVTPVVEPDRSAQCLAYNMYHEARSQGTAGIYAVSAVVLNRVNDRRFPNTVCEVVEQGPTRESWKTKKHKDLDPEERVYYPIKNKCTHSHSSAPLLVLIN